MVIGEAVELAIRKIGQLISNPTNIIPKECLRRQQETMIWRKQFLYVFVQVAVSECSYYFEWSTILDSYTCARFIAMVTHVLNDGSVILGQFSSKYLCVPSYMPSFGEKD